MKILICDDHKIFREGVRHILNRITEVTLIEEAGEWQEVSDKFNNETYDIVLLDISLPNKSGLDILQWIKEKSPTTNVLMLSSYSEEQYAIRSLKLGASGYLTKETTSDELLVAIKKIATGGKYISSTLAERLANQLDKNTYHHKHELLSQREFEIMMKIVQGKSLQEIGDELFISSKTVSTYRGRIMEKMEFKKNTELARYCMDNNLI